MILANDAKSRYLKTKKDSKINIRLRVQDGLQKIDSYIKKVCDYINYTAVPFPELSYVSHGDNPAKVIEEMQKWLKRYGYTAIVIDIEKMGYYIPYILVRWD